MKINLNKSFTENGYISGGKFVNYGFNQLPVYYKNRNSFYSIYSPNESLNGRRGIYKFYMGDNEEFYKKNLKEMPDDWYYRTKDVTYTLNSKGYRAKEFDEYDWSEAIVLFGCSCTFGVGVSDDETISYYLSEMTGRGVINLGVPGGSNQFMLDQSVILKKNYPKPYAIIMLWTVTDRIPYYAPDKLYHMGSWNLLDNISDVNRDEYTDIHRDIIKNIYFDSSNEYISFKNIVDTNSCIWKDDTIYVESSFFEPTAHYGELFNVIPFDPSARDLIHPNHTNFKFGAEILLERITQEYGDDIIKKT
jgi:hypothetical protein